MKNIFLILSTLFAVFVVSGSNVLLAQAPQSVLHIRISHNLPIKVALDGEKSPDVRPEHVITTISGKHKLRVTLPPPDSRPYNPTITLFKGYVKLKPYTETFAYIDRNGNFRIHREIPLAHNHNTPDNAPPPVDENPYNNGQYQPQPAPPTPAPAPQLPAMSSQQFEQLKQVIRDKAFDDERLGIAKQAVSTNRISSDQVRDLLNIFSFEASRLDIAKFAYGYCADPQNYQVVYSGFKFNSSTNELLEYIKNYK